MYPPVSDAGGQPPFKYPFAMAHKPSELGGWTRQVTVRDFPAVEEDGWRGDAPNLRGCPRAALACGLRVGLHDVRQCAYSRRSTRRAGRLSRT